MLYKRPKTLSRRKSGERALARTDPHNPWSNTLNGACVCADVALLGLPSYSYHGHNVPNVDLLFTASPSFGSDDPASWKYLARNNTATAQPDLTASKYPGICNRDPFRPCVRAFDSLRVKHSVAPLLWRYCRGDKFGP